MTALAAPPALTTVRSATDADMPHVGALFKTADYLDQDVDWTRPHLAPYWLVADREGEIVGAVQVVAGRPYGFIGEIVVHPSVKGRRADGVGSLRGRLPGSVATDLYLEAMRQLRGAGVQVIYGFVSDTLPGLQRIASRFYTDLGRGRLYGARCER